MFSAGSDPELLSRPNEATDTKSSRFKPVALFDGSCMLIAVVRFEPADWPVLFAFAIAASQSVPFGSPSLGVKSFDSEL